MKTSDGVLIYFGEEETPKWYTKGEKVDNLVGLKSRCIHVHFGRGWQRYISVSDQDRLIINLSCNPTVIFTIGRFDPEVRKMLLTKILWKDL